MEEESKQNIKLSLDFLSPLMLGKLFCSGLNYFYIVYIRFQSQQQSVRDCYGRFNEIYLVLKQFFNIVRCNNWGT